MTAALPKANDHVGIPCIMRNIPFGKFPLMKNNPRTFAKTSRFPLRIPVWKSVDAYWHPLTPEHGFPSLNSYKAQGAPPRPAAIRRIPFLLSRSVLKQKTGDTSADIPCKNSSHDFLRRHYPHQVKGRSSITSSQPANELPCFC